MNVIALWHAPLLPRPGSSVINPVALRSLLMSTATSPSVPRTKGRRTVLP
jgi:hypothetical protein